MCTTIAVGRGATKSGEVIIAHSDDDVSDERLIFVPAADHAAGSTRPVYYDSASLGDMIDPVSGKPYNASNAYRYIGSSRGPGYEVPPEKIVAEGLYPSIRLGEIPQVPHTYAYFDSNYAVMNEHRLMMGECTCGAKIHPTPAAKRMFYSAELGRVALERCTRAREAIRLMGELIRDYGYYGTGETLLIGDTEEAWVMEMCGYDAGDGLWVAQRVPDNGFFVAANQFRIRDVIVDSPDMMYSDNLHNVCRGLGWWLPAEAPLLDWAATVSYGEYSHPYYALRRVWRAMQKAKPSANLPAWVDNGYTRAYPFSVVPDVKLDVAGVIGIYRDNYEGTEFDQSRGAAAGPWSDPTRYEVNPDKGNAFELGVTTPAGAWERPISIYRCGMLWINESGAQQDDAVANGICWLGLDRPATTCLMPFYCRVTELPACVQTMNILDFSFDSAWWAFNFTANYVTLKYAYMIQDVQTAQTTHENDAYAKVRSIAADPETSVEQLTAFCAENANDLCRAWWSLARNLIVTYNDGCRTDKAGIMQKIDYPATWLEKTSYYRGPVSYSRQECLANPLNR